MARTVVHQDLRSYFGSEDHLEIAQSRSFVSIIFELLSERAPTGEELKIFELILNLNIDHGPDTPSAVKTIEAAQNGQTISEAVAAGVAQINQSHGGAVEPIMEILYQLHDHQLHDRSEVVKGVVEQNIKDGKRLPGFGHRIYKELDPRAQLILTKLKEAGLGEEYIGITSELKTELERQTGKTLPLNVDGAIAVALCSFGWNSNLGKAVFIIARIPGLCGQYLNHSNQG